MKKKKFDFMFYFLYIVVILSICASFFVQYFLYLGIVLSLLIIVFSSSERIFYLLLTLLPLTYVLKIGSDDSSLFTYIYMISVVKIFISAFFEGKAFKKHQIILYLFALVFSLLTMVNEMNSLLKFTLGMLSLLIFKQYSEDINPEKMLLFLIVGVSVSIVFGFFINKIDRLNYLFELGDSTIYRFSGLNTDPNYFNIEILMILSGLVILADRKKIKLSIAFPLIVTLFFIGMLTYSKSYFISLIIMLLLYFVIKKSFKKSIGIIFIFLLGVIIILVLDGDSVFRTLIERFSDSSDFNQFTSSRYIIWKDYIEQITSTYSKFLFGNGIGIGYLSGESSHNTVIQIFYNIGFLGLLIVSIYLLSMLENECQYTDYLSYLPIIMLILSTVTLDYLFNPKFYIFYVYSFVFINKSGESLVVFS